MPYITQDRRTELDFYPSAKTPGELNYCITWLIDEYIKSYGLSYHVINEVIGVLECTKLELYRRIAAPYEDKKIAENGDVYTIER